MRRWRAAVLIVSAGLLTFGVVFTLLQVTRSEAAPGQAVVVAATPIVAGAARAKDSLALKMTAGSIALGVPIGGSELLLRDVQPGDRLDVLASVPSLSDGRPITAVVVRGATVLEPATSSSPLMLEVSPADAVALAHLVLGGTHLGYILWSANEANPPPTRPMDEQTARVLLGLALTATPQVELTATAAPSATPAPAPTQTPVTSATSVSASAGVPRFGGFLYQVQEGDTWDSIASTFSLSVAELKHWNETTADAELAPRTLVFVPRLGT